MEKTLTIASRQDIRIQQTKLFIDEGVSISQGTYRTVDVRIIMMPQVRQNLIEQRTAYLNIAARVCAKPRTRIGQHTSLHRH